jgi:hypothetical protein
MHRDDSSAQLPLLAYVGAKRQSSANSTAACTGTVAT